MSNNEAQRYGEFEQVNGAVANSLLDSIAELEAERDALNSKVRELLAINEALEHQAGLPR